MADKVQAKLRVALNLIDPYAEQGAVGVCDAGSDLADTAAFNCSKLTLRAAIELHNDISAALRKEDEHHA